LLPFSILYKVLTEKPVVIETPVISAIGTSYSADIAEAAHHGYRICPEHLPAEVGSRPMLV